MIRRSLLLFGVACAAWFTVAALRLEEKAHLTLLDMETAPHPEPWPRPPVLLIFSDSSGFDFAHPADEPCEVQWSWCPGHTQCITRAEAQRRQRAWRLDAAETLRAYGWTVVEPPEEQQTGEVRTTTSDPTRGGRL